MKREELETLKIEEKFLVKNSKDSFARMNDINTCISDACFNLLCEYLSIIPTEIDGNIIDASKYRAEYRYNDDWYWGFSDDDDLDSGMIYAIKTEIDDYHAVYDKYAIEIPMTWLWDIDAKMEFYNTKKADMIAYYEEKRRKKERDELVTLKRLKKKYEGKS